MASVLGEEPNVRRAADAEAGREKLYALDMFPYPSGDGLHVGHPEGYTATDIVCRAARMQGKSVMHPMGFDAFGLPAEEHAIKTGEHPRIADRKEHRHVPPAVEVARLLVRLVPRAGDDRRRVRPLDAVDLSADLRHVVRRRAAARPADQRVADSRRRASRKATTRSARIRTSIASPIKAKRR